MDKTGIIFDMDGVLVDSEDAMSIAAVQALSEFGIHAKTEDFLPFRGMGDDRYMGGVAEKYGVPYDARMKEKGYELFTKMAKKAVFVFEGAAQLLIRLKEKGAVLALASGADKIKVDANLDCLGVGNDIFSAVVTGSDKTPIKPNPDIFLLAAERAGLLPRQCFVVEDAISGVKAGKAAAMKVIAVTTSFSADELRAAGADHIIDKVDKVYDIIYSRKEV